jgi:RimJ/RimL family protein N-acetyltransferase
MKANPTRRANSQWRLVVMLQTDRLTLRMLREPDLRAYAEICAQPEVTRYLGDGQPVARPMA